MNTYGITTGKTPPKKRRVRKKYHDRILRAYKEVQI